MKKVRRHDLIVLIAGYYWEFIDPEHKPINDIISGCGDIKIDVNSICFTVRDFKGLFSKDDVKEAIMNDFAKNIEAITFGNLKVTRVRDDEIFIANAYEVID